MPYMTASSFLGLGRETVRGTAVAPTVYLPCEAPDTQLKTTWLPDTGMRGSPVVTYGDIAGVQNNELSYKGNLFPDTIQYLFAATLGGTDTVTGTGPYVHTVPLLRSASTGSQPSSWTNVDYDGTDYARQMAGGAIDELTLTFGVDAALGFEAKWITNPQTNISAPTASFSTEVFVPTWDTAVSIDAGAVATVETGELNLKRSTAPIHTLGSQGPYFNFAGPLDVTGKVTFVYEAGNATIANASASSKHVWVLTFTEPTSGHTVAVTMSKVQYMNPKIERGKSYVEVSCDFAAEANTTDAAAGYSPIKTVTTNSVSAAA